MGQAANLAAPPIRFKWGPELSTIANRLPGVIVAAGGMLLVLYIVPNHTESVDYGWMRPQTLPLICGVVLVLLGALNALLPVELARVSTREAARAVAFAILTAAALIVMARLGYLAGAAALALVVMLAVGERRPVWLALGTVGAPAAIWTIAVPLLDRTLP